MEKLPDISKPRYGDNYMGRVLGYLGTIDPRMCFVSDATAKEAVETLERYKKGDHIGLTPEKIWRAKQIKDAVIHPDTGEKIFPLARFCAFVPVNVPIVAGMMNHTGPFGTIFWQWFNQSYNSLVNFSNRSASSNVSTQQLAMSYGAAVATSCGLAMGLKKLAARTGSQGFLATTMVPYVAVASAGALNVLLMRYSELTEGVIVRDAAGNEIGKSQIAGRMAVQQTALTRIALPVPVLALPPTVMYLLRRLPSVRALRGPAAMGLELSVVTACLWLGLPASIGLFPQEVSLSGKKLEPQYHQYDTVKFNKGL